MRQRSDAASGASPRWHFDCPQRQQAGWEATYRWPACETQRVKIREAQSDDAGAIADLLADLGYPTAPEAVRSRLGALGDGDLVLLADDGVGLIALHRVPRLAEGGAFTRITALVVARSYRSRGIARGLLAAAEQVARRWGCDVLEVSSGRRSERADAHALYSAAGFSDTSARSVRYWKAVPTDVAPA
jgi:GNAT superfamily N-acetyltransferase